MKISTLRAVKHAAALLFLSLAVSLAAQGQQWTGATNNFWNDPGNWSPAAVPAKSPATSLVFDAGASSFTPNANEVWLLGSMTFTSTGYSVSGLDLSLDGVATILAPSGTTTIANQLLLFAPPTFSVAAGGTLALTGGIQGGLDILKAGPGHLAITASVYPSTHATVIQQGSLTFGDGADGPVDIGSIVNDGTLVFDVPFTDVHGPVTGTGTLTIEAGSVVVNRSGAGFAHQGITTVDGQLDGTTLGFSVNNNALLTIGATGRVDAFTGAVGSLAGSGQLVVTANTFFAGGDNTSTVFSGTLGGAGDFTKVGSGTLTFATNTWFGGTATVEAPGTMSLGDGATGPFNVNAPLVANGSLVFANPFNTNVNGVVTGNGTVTILPGARIVNASGAGFSHLGSTTVDGIFDGTSLGFSVNNNARLTIGATGRLDAFTGSVGSLEGAGQLTVTANTFFAGSDNTSTTFSGSLTGPGNFTKTGAGTLTFTDLTWIDGTATVEAPGTITLGNGAAGPNSVNAFIVNGELNFAKTSNTDVNGLVTGTGTVTVQPGASVTNRSGAGFAHQGPTTVHGIFDGTSLGFSVDNNARLTIGPLGQFFAFNGTVGSLDGSGRLEVTANTFTAGGDNTSTTFSGDLDGAGNFAKVGAGTLTFSGGGSWISGTTSVDPPGTLRLGDGVTGPSTVRALLVNGSLVFATPLIDALGPLTGTGTITIDAGSTVRNTGVAPFMHMGTTTVNGIFDGASFGNSVSNNALLTLGGPAAQFHTFDGTVGSLTGSGQLIVATGTTFTVGGDNISTTFAGTLSGAGALAKIGTGVLTLSGTSPPGTGGIMVNAGTLSITGGFFTSGVTVASGATLMGGGSIAGPVTINAGATLAPGLSAGNLDTESLTLAGTLNAEIFGTTPGTQHDSVNVLGTVTLNNPALSLSGAHVPAAGNVFILIANDGADAVVGTFAALPEGATFTFNGATVRVSYMGGDGNDVALSHAAYNVTASGGPNGTIAPLGTVSVTHGTAATFTITANAGYTASVGGTCPAGAFTPPGSTTYITGNIVADCSVVASFTLNTYTVTSGGGPNGTVAPPSQLVNHGSTTTFTVTPDPGYTASVGGTCPPGSLVGTTYTTGIITGACDVAATFALNSYTVTATAGANGTIAPPTQNVAHGGTTNFTVTPNAGFTATMGGTCPAGSLVGTTYTTGVITAACTVTASFTLNTYTVTATAGASGTIAPPSQNVAHGGTTTFTVTPNAGFAATMGGTCAAGSLVGATYTTGVITAACTVTASFSASAVTSFTGPTATGTGNATASFTGGGPACTYATAQFIPVTGHAASPPAGTAPASIVFPHGLFDFRLTGCTPGSTIVLTITYPATLAAGTSYWKYGPEPGNATPHWYVMPSTLGATTATFSITDGLQGDDDLAANGTIVDQGGPGVPLGPGAIQTPTMSEWMMMLMAALMLLGGMWRRAERMRRRRPLMG